MIGATDGMLAMHCYIREYAVKPDRVAEFEAGSGGEWFRYIRRDAAYLRSGPIRGCDEPNRFVTINDWLSRDALLAALPVIAGRRLS